MGKKLTKKERIEADIKRLELAMRQKSGLKDQAIAQKLAALYQEKAKL